MDLKSVSGLVYEVTDLEKSAAFYDAIGFRFGNKDEKKVRIYINWFSVELVQTTQAMITSDKSVFACIKVDNANDAYKSLIELGMKPESEPVSKTKGSNEFVLCDPDGHQLLFFDKK